MAPDSLTKTTSETLAIAIHPSRLKWDKEPFLLFVEGYSDLIFYAELLKSMGYSRSEFYIETIEGKSGVKLRQFASLHLKPDNLQIINRVGVILDADNDAQAAFQIAQSALKDSANVTIPTPNQWVQNGKTKFGIFIVSGTGGKGEIESLVWESWKGNGPLRSCVDQFINCSEATGFRLKSIDKVRIGAVLSVMNEDDPRLGPGARNRLFDFSANEFTPLKSFLAR